MSHTIKIGTSATHELVAFEVDVAPGKPFIFPMTYRFILKEEQAGHLRTVTIRAGLSPEVNGERHPLWCIGIMSGDYGADSAWLFTDYAIGNEDTALAAHRKMVNKMSAIETQ